MMMAEARLSSSSLSMATLILGGLVGDVDGVGESVRGG